MNLLDLTPMLDRHLRQYRVKSDTPSVLAGYLADAVQALEHRWTRDYAITFIAPATYTVTPDVASGDIRSIVLMASIIYKMGNVTTAKFSDGDFSYDPTTTSTLQMDITELKNRVPAVKLASGTTAPMRGFNNIYNRETYDWTFLIDLIAY